MRRVYLLGGVLACLATTVALAVFRMPAPPQGCASYTPADQPLVAHAGGGLPDRIYANTLPAMKLARAHGFRWIELDFIQTPDGLRLGHEANDLSATTVSDLLEWLRTEPDVRIVTDFKTSNVEGLALLKAQAGPLQNRFIPQIYSPTEYRPVVGMGYAAPIFTAYRSWWLGWQRAVNDLPVRAVTIPYDRRILAHLIDHPVFLHTVNFPVEGVGLYTDCLIPG